MIAAFVHDHNFVFNADDGLVYDGSGGVFAGHLWSRYLEIFDRLIVVGREKRALPNKLVVASAENVDFYLIDSLPRGINRYFRTHAIKEELRKALTGVDLAIIRVPSTLGYLAQSVCIAQNKPYVLEVVGCAWDAYWNYGKLSGKLLAPIEMSILKRAASLSKFNIYVTQNFLQNRYSTSGRQIGISNVNIATVKSQEEVHGFYKNYMQPGNDQKFVVGLVGTFHVRYKGHLEALKAFRKLIYTYNINNIKLLLVGTGNPDWIKKIINRFNLNEYVEIIGTLEAGDGGILPFLDSIHLYIHPSRQEGLPRVIVEAMSRGRICLAASVAGVPELLNEKFLHKPGNWKRLAQQILEIQQNSADWLSIVKANIEKAHNYIEKSLQEKRCKFLIEAHNSLKNSPK